MTFSTLCTSSNKKVGCENAIMKKGPSSFIAPFTVRDQADLPEVLMHRDMAV
jgi:hypothetical protein